MDRLIDPALRRPRFGRFADAVGGINLEDYTHRTPMGARASRFAAWSGFKQFEYFGLISDGLLFGCALAHLRFAAVAFVYVYVPGRGMLVERSLRMPLGRGLQQSRSPREGVSTWQGGGLEVEMRYHAAPRAKDIRLQLGELSVAARCDEQAAGFEPMSLCTRIGRNGWVYAHKVAGVPVSGTLQLGAERFDLATLGAYAHHDYSAGYMRRDTFWNWACFSGRGRGGEHLGLNVSCGVNETSHSENCAWVDGRLHPLGLCQFDYDWDRPAQQPWRVQSSDRALHLRFTPEGAHVEQLNAGLFASDFKQIFGRFDGALQLSDGRRVEIERQWGFVEDQFARW